MQRPNPPTFHPTVWPADPPDVERVTQWELRPLDTEGVFEALRPVGEVALPPDFVFQELLALGASPKAHAATATTWGLLCLPGGDVWRYHRRNSEPRGDMEIRADALTTHLRAAQALARHVLVFLEGGSDDDLLTAWNAGDYIPRDAITNVWSLWETTMNRGLAAYPVHVSAFAETPASNKPTPTLYTACCLQLARYLRSAAPSEMFVKRCANERCGQPFTKQRGDAKYGHRSRGVLYCSTQCAKAQSERERRRRRAAERNAQ